MTDNMKPATFNLSEDTQIRSDYGTAKHDFHTIFDSGTSSAYPFGNIQFNSQNISQLTKSQQFMPQEAYLTIPLTYTMSIANGQFAYAANTPVPSNVFALAKKSALALFEKTTESVGGVSLGFGTNQRQYHALLRANEATDDQVKFDYENFCDHYFPSTDIRKYTSALGEYDVSSKLKPDNRLPEDRGSVNKMFFEQNRKYIDYGAHSDGGVDVNPFSQLNSIANGSTPNTVRQLVPHFVNAVDKLTYYDVINVPLKMVTTAFSRLPSCSNLNGLQLLFSLPACANGVSMEIEYQGYADASTNAADGAIGKVFAVKTVTYNAGTSSCFPFIVGEAANNNEGLYPLTIRQVGNGTNPKITITAKIGWGDKLSGPNCQIRMPVVDVASHIDSIARNPKVKIDALDCVIDSNTFTHVNGGTSFQQRTIAQPHSKLRRVWLIPQLHKDSNGSVTKLDAPMSPFSMSPCWASPLSLDQLQVFVGGEPMFGQPITLRSHLYEIFHKHCSAQINGNSVNSIYKSGQWKMSDYLKNPIYCVNVLDHYTDEENDILPKQVSFSFNCDWVNGVYANIIVVFEKEIGFGFDRISGLVTQV